MPRSRSSGALSISSNGRAWRPQVREVAEHLAQWDVGGHGERVAAPLLALQPPAPAAQIADDVAEELLGRDDLDLEDRLEQDWLGALGGLLEGERPSDLEGDL